MHCNDRWIFDADVTVIWTFCIFTMSGGQRWWAIAFLVARLHCLVLYENIVFVFLANKYSLSLSILLLHVDFYFTCFIYFAVIKLYYDFYHRTVSIYW